MRFRPENERINTKEMAECPEGVYTMTVANYSENVTAPSGWQGDIVEFTNGTYRISEFITLDTSWKFGRLAKALGDVARAQYHDTDSEGYSLFNPGAWVDKGAVTVTVETTINPKTNQEQARIKKIEPADLQTRQPSKTEQMREDLQNNPAQSVLKTDDIPF
mgnify:FL=1